MKYKKVLLTGASGKLGQAILKSKYFPSLLSPSHAQVDITDPMAIETFFHNNQVDALIHCAALARMSECESNPREAIRANIIGTANLVMQVLKQEQGSGKKIRFVYISTDAVYPGKRGGYSERGETIPYNKYGWSKLGAECAVNMLSNFCIIRTSFFDPQNIKFSASASDAYSSKIEISYLVKAIAKMLKSDFIGTVNIGGPKKSDYLRYKEFKPSLKPTKLRNILQGVSFEMAKDASLNYSLWKELQKQKIGLKCTT
ncbi:MAG: sugar nucleotide-binding protein [Candidatus Omnitrophica bacterium]|nr:sugar nucleotide-binding protein [Candidatus Omnitrophota bacterium]